MIDTYVSGTYRQAHRFQERRHPVPPGHERVKMLLCEAGYPGEQGDRWADAETDPHVPSYDTLMRAHQLAGPW